MNTKITVSMVAAAVVAVSMAFVPASADTRGVEVAAPGQPVAVVAAETPQDAVYDMTYGADQPIVVAQSGAGEFQQNDETVDLSMG
ncbi:MAG: hypothetical protein IPL06_16080 [Betaproteobacteria bacterium]|nr:hypothetical protein [Betaproteobacteria bacterium]